MIRSLPAVGACRRPPFRVVTRRSRARRRRYGRERAAPSPEVLDRAAQASAGGIPFDVQAFKLGLLALWPFGRTVVGSDDPGTFT
jgi:hypothetical protein